MFKNVKELMEALLAGKKLRHSSWPKYQYVYMSGKDGDILREDNVSWTRDITSWCEYVPEKRKIKLAPAIYGSVHQNVTDRLFSSEEEARTYLWDMHFIKWLIGTSYEVEIEIDDSV